VVLYATASVRKERDAKLEEKASLERQIEELKAESLKLDAKKDYVGTKKFTEEMARKVLGLVYPDEIIFQEKGEGER
nr:septum formation initiator family protein [Lachnospiraceae bacterium]